MNIMPDRFVKLEEVLGCDDIEAIGYAETTRRLYIKRPGKAPLCYEGVPRFRYSGFLTCPPNKRDTYFKTQIQPVFAVKEIPQIPGDVD
ncbi:MAG: KTSC domain-containing protein [Verrucomicrobiae bacterium]|nr:KTSC domain-containing protein [Verrucomicrobiae bacterium]